MSTYFETEIEISSDGDGEFSIRGLTSDGVAILLDGLRAEIFIQSEAATNYEQLKELKGCIDIARSIRSYVMNVEELNDTLESLADKVAL